MVKRKADSLGTFYKNAGRVKQVEEKPFELDYTRQFYLFSIVPMGGVRMSSSDRWKTNPNHPDPKKRQREKVTRYFAFRDTLRWQANKMRFTLKDDLEIVFLLPMPASWSQKKKERMNGMPSKSKPDNDNLQKGFTDALTKEDGRIWKINSEKRYAYFGSIIVYE